MFKLNDWVMYPGAGVFQIKEICNINNQLFFKLKGDKKPTILIPVNSKNKSSIRGLSNEHDLNTALRIIKTEHKYDLPKYLPSLEKILKNKYSTGSVFEIADIVGILKRLKQKRKLSVNEVKFLDSSIDQLSDELLIVKNISKKEAIDMILNNIH